MARIIIFLFLCILHTSLAQCPWGRDPLAVSLQATCICSTNPESGGALSVQCQATNFEILMQALQTYTTGDTVIENLYVNNTKVVLGNNFNDESGVEGKGRLTDFMFKNLKIINLQITFGDLSVISANAFRGLENTLQSLNLADNKLRSVPVQALRKLRLLRQLDLTNNKIKFVPDNAFVTLRLRTLKLGGNNNITLSNNALRGLESSLKNLNLKGCHLKDVPGVALRNLKGLAFLDLAQNNIRKIDSGLMAGLDSLTALNLERNAIQKLQRDIFEGVNDTLSSLSLLNNLLTEYPIEAINSLKELRVLDLGFNLIRILPINAFYHINELTLLALDGNPMATLPEDAFKHLNSSLRGLSLGGRFLTCDCKIRWVAEWIRSFDLQVTSRERNPQFCGNPQRLRDRNFYQLGSKDLICGPPPTKPTTTPRTTTRIPTPVPTIVTAQPDVMTGKRQNVPRRRNGVISPNGNSFLSNARRIPDTAQKSTFNSGTPKPVKKFNSNPGDIVTEIKMTVGQGDSRSTLDAGKDIIRVPPPVDISSAPSHALAGRPRGTPVRSSLSNLRTRPNTVSSNLNVQKGGIRQRPNTVSSNLSVQKGGLRQNSFTGQIIPRPKNDGLSPSNPRAGGNYRNEIKGGSLANNNVPNKRLRGSATLSTTQKASQNLGNNNPNSNSGFLSRSNVFGGPSSSPSPPRRQNRPIDISSVIRRPLNHGSSNTNNKHESQGGLIAAASDRNNAAPSSNSLIEGGLELRSQNPLIAGGGRFAVKGSQLPRQSSNSNGIASTSAEEVIVREAYKEDNLIVIKWDSETSNILGFRVVYRLFGKPEFKQGPPLGPSEREFRIKNVPANVCIAVCVVSLEDTDITPASVPYEQCREIRTEGIGTSRQLDYIIIPASAAIVATVIIAVIIFIACLKTSQKKRDGKNIHEEKPIHTLSMNGMGAGHLPPAPMVGPPLAGLASLGFGPTQKEWDQLSMYSQRTDRSAVPRGRLYQMDRGGSINGGYIPEDARSHISHLSQNRGPKSRATSIADLTGKPPYPVLGMGLTMSRPDLRQSRQSLFAPAGSEAGGRQSRASGRRPATDRSAGSTINHRQSTRSRSRDRLTSGGSGYLAGGMMAGGNPDDSMNEDIDSDNWAGTSTDNNWTDYDQDIYMHRNPTHRGRSRDNISSYGRDDVNL